MTTAHDAAARALVEAMVELHWHPQAQPRAEAVVQALKEQYVSLVVGRDDDASAGYALIAAQAQAVCQRLLTGTWNVD